MYPERPIERPPDPVDGEDARLISEEAPPEIQEPGYESVEWGAAGIAKRVRRLIAQHDGGDVGAAARRLGVPVQHLIRLESVLSEWAADSLFSSAAQDLLTAVVLRYRTDATWLLTGSERPSIRGFPTAVRLWLANFFLAVGNRVLSEYHETRSSNRSPETGVRSRRRVDD